MSHDTRVAALHNLASVHGIQLEYWDALGNHRAAEPDSLLAVLRALGVPVASLDDVEEALAESTESGPPMIEPVIVDWVGTPTVAELWLPAGRGDDRISCRLRLEDGTRREWEASPRDHPGQGSRSTRRDSYLLKAFPLPDGLPWGYHTLEINTGDAVATTTIITTPLEAFTGPRGTNRRMWGAFLPLYAVHHAEGMGFGTYSDLQTLVSWVRDMGGDMFGTLPLLATFLNEPFEPSPYSPVSRRFWNEFYIDLDAVPEMDASATARAMLLSGDIQRELEDLRSNELVDYRRAATLKRKLLAELSRTLVESGGERQSAFAEWVERNPLAVEYARFMGVVDRRREPWQEWPERLRDGEIEAGDMDEADVHYHLYVQWVAEQQISAVAGDPGAGGSGLYLDLPLGVHKSGFDVWRDRRAFALDARVGAPPDLLNENGQDWGFPPMHPERVREDGYDYFRQSIRHHLRHAGALRVDHVMGLHRLYWIPGDAPATDGVYVNYRADEMYAIMVLESHRSRTLMIGEDLGTVPDEVRDLMGRHQFQGMYVVPFQVGDEHEDALRPVGDTLLATLNTHDLAPFATEWERMEAGDRERITRFLHDRGWLENQTDDPQSVLGALIRFIGDSPASMVLVNLEDLWLETEQQNVPGTTDEHPNWQRKARYDLDAFTRMPRVTDLLRELDLLRKRGR